MLRRLAHTSVVITTVIVGIALPATVLGNTGFSLTADRSSVAKDVTTSVTATIRPEDQDDVDNHCYAIEIPGAFVIQSAQVTATPDGSTWAVDVSGGRVRLRSMSGDREIEDPERLSVSITVRGTTAGAYTWVAGGYDNNYCANAPVEQRSIPMAISGAAATPPPTPPPTPKPTPQPTPVTTPGPTPRVTPWPTPQPPPGAPGATPPSAASISPGGVPSAEPSASARPSDGSPSATPSPSPAARASQDVIPPGVFPALPDQGFVVASVTEQTDVGTVDIALRDGMLAVPAAVIAGPGLLVLIWIGLQSVGTLAWAPAVRRLRGGSSEAQAAKRRAGPGSIGLWGEDSDEA